jgi:hypothetical protein
MNPSLTIPRQALAAFCREHGISRMAIFGSALRGALRADSDIDLVVTFEKGRTPGLLGLAQMELDLSALFKGRKIDLRTPDDLSRYFRKEVMATAEVVYAG